MLDEKRTAAALKEAWRKDGYRFVYSNGILSVRATGWGFQGALKNIPVKVIGLIAEHFGSFPEDGDAFELKKDEAEQSVMYDQEAERLEKELRMAEPKVAVFRDRFTSLQGDLSALIVSIDELPEDKQAGARKGLRAILQNALNMVQEPEESTNE